MIDFARRPVTVRVPATSANLGPGFDSLGLALSWYDEVTARVTDSGVNVVIDGEGAGSLPGDESHLVVATMHRVFAELDVPPPGLSLHCRNAIPHARGLGSSSAAIVAGVLAAAALLPGAGLDDLAALRLATDIEGHPDNVAPCLLGGFTIAFTDADGVRAVRLPVADGVVPIVCVPEQRGLTATARAALPDRVPHADAAFTAGRAALLVHALTNDPAMLLAATDDRLHQPYRADAMPDSMALVTRLRAAGVPAAISGAGPAVLALTGADTDLGALTGVDGFTARRMTVADRALRIELFRTIVEHACTRCWHAMRS